MPELPARFLRDETGAAGIEYGLIAAGIGLAVFGAVKLVGPGVKDLFNNIAPGVSNVTGEVLIDRNFDK